MPATALPSLSDVRAFTGEYLIDAAQHWSASAQRWTDTFDRLTREVLRPAGTEWLGEAAESAALRVGTDRVRVAGVADDLQAAAATARRAAADLHAAKTKLLNNVRAAQAARFTVGEDFSLTSLETGTPREVAAREAQARAFADAIRADVLALISADEQAAAQITNATAGLQSLSFGSPEDTGAVETTGFHGIPFPEKPANPPAIPPPEGWSQDPLMRAAQKIAYGHAYEKHKADFSGMTNEQLARLIHQKMQRSMTDPSGLTIGLSKSDGVPVIYDPQDNLLIVRDTKPNAPDGGTIFKPPNHNYVTEKFGSYTSIFTPEQLADGAVTPLPPGEPTEGGTGTPPPPPPGQASTGGGGGGGSWRDDGGTKGSFPDLGSVKEWGTYVPPEELAKSDGALGILGRIILGQTRPDRHDPDSWA